MPILFMLANAIVESMQPVISYAYGVNNAPRHLCVKGFPYFSAGGILISVNLVMIGYYQSIEKNAKASLLMLLRGFVIVMPVFILLPKVLGDPGMWLAIPLAELLTLLVILLGR